MSVWPRMVTSEPLVIYLVCKLLACVVLAGVCARMRSDPESILNLRIPRYCCFKCTRTLSTQHKRWTRYHAKYDHRIEENLTSFTWILVIVVETMVDIILIDVDYYLIESTKCRKRLANESESINRWECHRHSYNVHVMLRVMFGANRVMQHATHLLRITTWIPEYQNTLCEFNISLS